MQFSEKILELARQAEQRAKPYYNAIDAMAEKNTAKVLSAFQKHRVSDMHFAGTTGYGYDDVGRDTLDAIYADIFQTEAALVRLGFVNGTHAITCALFGCVKPGQTLLAVTGAPYDTLAGVIGITDKGYGSLVDYGVKYQQIDMVERKPDYTAIEQMAAKLQPAAVHVQRSRGYDPRPSLSVEEIGRICETVKKVSPDTVIVVDNCYGEFVEELEPTQVGADLIAGSLIKNPGGGLAPTGGYIAGHKELVERAAARMTAPGIGGEAGCTLGNNRLFYQGLFMAPHTVAQAVKTAVFCASMMDLMGYKTSPAYDEPRRDIIQVIDFGKPEPVLKFCRGIQAGAPVDSYVTPEPWAMPGYDSPVVMAAGAFIQGASIELSCDAPMREPYTLYMQGGLTYESGKLGVMLAAQTMLED